MTFKRDDLVKKKDGQEFTLGMVRTGFMVAKVESFDNSTKQYKIRFADGRWGWIPESLLALVNPIIYEDEWVLNVGQGVPSDAKTICDTTGDVVAFKCVKKPEVKELVRWMGRGQLEPTYFGSVAQCHFYKHKVIFTEIDGVLTNVRLEK